MRFVCTVKAVLVLALATLCWPQLAFSAVDNKFNPRNGVFHVPLEVRDNSGVARHAWPVTTGVPLPPGMVPDVSRLRLVDASGREIPCQFAPLNRYFARDGSIRWVLLDFQVDVPANGATVVRLTNDQPAASVSEPLRVASNTAEITVDTGPLRVVVGKHDPSLLTAVAITQKPVLESGTGVAPGLRTGDVQLMEHNRGHSWNNAGWIRETTLERHYVAEADYRARAGQDVEIELQGPMRTVLVVRGSYQPVVTGRGIVSEVYRYTTRVTFYRGHSFVKLEHDIENSSREQPQMMYLFREASLNYRLKLTGSATYTAGGWTADATTEVSGSGTLAENAEAWLVQTKPAIMTKNGRNTGQEGGFVAGAGRAGSVAAPVVTGARGRYLDVSDGQKGLAVAMRYMWEEAPRAISASRDRLAVLLHADTPDRTAPAGDRRPEYWLDFGERNLHDVLLYFHNGSAKDARVAEVAEAFEYPLLAYAPPAWYADSGAWYFELSAEPSERGANADPHWRPDLVGVRAHGENSSYNSGGHHDSQTSGWLPFIRSGNLTELERQLARSRWSIAHNPGWVYQDNRLSFGSGNDRYASIDRSLIAWNRLTGFAPKDFYLWKAEETESVRSAGKTKQRQHGGRTYLNGYKILPDIDHYALFRLFEYYNLTGDPRALDAIHGFVDWALNFEHRNLFKGKTLGLDVTDYFARDPLAMYRGHYSRIYAWMLFTTVAGYQVTGSPVFDEYARWQIRRTLALLRDRHGQLTRVSPSSGDGDSGDGDADEVAVIKKSDGVPRSKTQTWMEAINVAALHEAYKTYDDERILDGIWAQADYFSHHVIYFPKLGMLNNWTSMPNAPLTGAGEGNARRLTPIRHDFQTLAWPLLYRYTGWPDVHERFMGAEEARKGASVTPYFLQTVYWQAQNAKRSNVPPEPVTDLKVLKADRSGIALSWTSPKDDSPSGHASRYFVKISDKPIVEFAPTDDPARDADKRRIVMGAESAALSTGSHAHRVPKFKPTDIRGEDEGIRREHPDWYKVNAFWMAEHVAGEPVPGPAGTRESFVITELRPHQWFGAPKQPGLEILPPGTYYVALCSWDEDQNLSRLSNVASFTLR